MTYFIMLMYTHQTIYVNIQSEYQLKHIYQSIGAAGIRAFY